MPATTSLPQETLSVVLYIQTCTDHVMSCSKLEYFRHPIFIPVHGSFSYNTYDLDCIRTSCCVCADSTHRFLFSSPAWSQGDPRKVIYPTNSRGEFCGQAGTDLEWVELQDIRLSLCLMLIFNFFKRMDCEYDVNDYKYAKSFLFIHLHGTCFWQPIVCVYE